MVVDVSRAGDQIVVRDWPSWKGRLLWLVLTAGVWVLAISNWPWSHTAVWAEALICAGIAAMTLFSLGAIIGTEEVTTFSPGRREVIIDLRCGKARKLDVVPFSDIDRLELYASEISEAGSYSLVLHMRGGKHRDVASFEADEIDRLQKLIVDVSEMTGAPWQRT